MELLLTGSTGFVGRNLLLRLLREKGEGNRWSRIILPVRNPEKLREQLAEEGVGIPEHLLICRVEGDAWRLPQGIAPDLAIHAAGKLFGREREDYLRTNAEGSLNLAEQLPRKTRLIVLSSLAAGGPTPAGKSVRGLGDEDVPVSYYGASKLAMEKGLREKLGDHLLILRPPMVLGPRDSATLPLFKMVQGLLRVKPGLKPKQYSWIAVEDLCDALLTAIMTDWPEEEKALYPSAAETITDIQLLETAAAVIGGKGFTLPLPHLAIQGISRVLDVVPIWREAVPSLGVDRVREILPDRWVCDGSLFTQQFRWQPRRSLYETLRDTAAWLRERGKI